MSTQVAHVKVNKFNTSMFFSFLLVFTLDLVAHCHSSKLTHDNKRHMFSGKKLDECCVFFISLSYSYISLIMTYTI